MKFRQVCGLFIVFGAVTFSGCMSAQQVRDLNIDKNIEIFQSFSQENQDKIRRGQVDIGFSEEMVLLAWGEANREHIRTTEKGTKTVWTYTRSFLYPKSELMSVPIHYIDSRGRRRVEYHSVWVNRDTKEEYAVARVEFKEGRVTAIEQIKEQ